MNGGRVVSLVATPATDYRFVSWIGHVGTNANAASTTVTTGGSYSIIANVAVAGWWFVPTAAYGMAAAEKITESCVENPDFLKP